MIVNTVEFVVILHTLYRYLLGITFPSRGNTVFVSLRRDGKPLPEDHLRVVLRLDLGEPVVILREDVDAGGLVARRDIRVLHWCISRYQRGWRASTHTTGVRAGARALRRPYFVRAGGRPLVHLRARSHLVSAGQEEWAGLRTISSSSGLVHHSSMERLYRGPRFANAVPSGGTSMIFWKGWRSTTMMLLRWARRQLT